MSTHPLPHRFRVYDPVGRRYLPASTVALDGNGHLLRFVHDYDPDRCQWSDAEGPDFHGCVIERATGLWDKTGRDIHEGDVVVTENLPRNGGDTECDEWKAEDCGRAIVSMDARHGVTLRTKEGDVWNWEDEQSMTHARFLRVVGTIHDADMLAAAIESAGGESR